MIRKEWRILGHLPVRTCPLTRAPLKIDYLIFCSNKTKPLRIPNFFFRVVEKVKISTTAAAAAAAAAASAAAAAAKP